MTHPTYRYTGIALLLLNAYLLYVKPIKFLMALATVPNYYRFVTVNIFFGSQYLLFLYMFWLIVYTAIALWGIVVAISLIRKNHYVKELKLWIYVLGFVKLLHFLLYLFAGSFFLVELVSGLIIFYFCFFLDSELSRLVKGEKLA